MDTKKATPAWVRRIRQVRSQRAVIRALKADRLLNAKWQVVPQQQEDQP